MYTLTEEQMGAVRQAVEWLDSYAADEYADAEDGPQSWAVTARAIADDAAAALAAVGVPIERADYGEDDDPET